MNKRDLVTRLTVTRKKTQTETRHGDDDYNDVDN